MLGLFYSCCVFFFKQKTAYEMLRSLVGSERCIRDRRWAGRPRGPRGVRGGADPAADRCHRVAATRWHRSAAGSAPPRTHRGPRGRPAHRLSLIHISEPTRLLSISYAVFCLKKKKKTKNNK